MDPPAPLLTWKQIVDYSFISEFELLKHSSSYRDITVELWAVPGNREMTTKHFKVIGAYKEIRRCNYEARRLRTSIRDEQQMYAGHIARVQPSDPDIASEIQRQANTRARVQAYIMVRLNAIESLPGFSGIRGCGVHRGAMDADVSEEEQRGRDVEEAIKRAHISVREEVIDEGLVGDEVDDIDGEGDLRDRIVDFSDAITQEPPPSTNTVPNSMLFSWTL